jgi:hypothetical protein
MQQTTAVAARSVIAKIWDAAKLAWWGFFDWVAIVSWGRLAAVWVVVFAISGVFHLGDVGSQFLMLSLGVKILAGGKRRSDQVAKEASQQADLEKLRRQLLEAQLNALLAQVEPHFLFNTLAMISQLIETDSVQAGKIHNHLVAYLRATLPQVRSSETPTLGREKELASSYLAIMQERMGERLDVDIGIPQELSALRFPPMMLQLLVENAIKHGVEPKVEGGRVEVRARLSDSSLAVSVKDTGVGFDPQSREGIGMSNIRERLRLLYGVRARFDIQRCDGGGTLATIEIPLTELAGSS